MTFNPLRFLHHLQVSISKNPGLEASFISLSTVNLDPKLPSCRTVVFRGLYKQHDIVVYTDRESAKYQELRKNNNVEICWYFRETREQYRIRGTARISEAGDDAELEAYKENCWREMSLKAKKLYLQVAGSSGTPTWNEESEQKAKERFVLLLISPSGVEYLNLLESNSLPVKL